MASYGITATCFKALFLKVVNEHHLTTQAAETLIMSGKYTQRWCLCKRERYHSRLISRWQMAKHAPSLSPNCGESISSQAHTLTKAILTCPKGSKNNVYFLPQTKWCKPLPNRWPSVQRNKDITTPIKGVGWVTTAIKDYLIKALKQQCESLALIF